MQGHVTAVKRLGGIQKTTCGKKESETTTFVYATKHVMHIKYGHLKHIAVDKETSITYDTKV